ncbi:hypothetical protein VNI00_010179 [Paramarasmius palmivorus]|uniref:Uncharacterized protein n=1 Tax=Paramarasmius palmivorus TaxID=297713 RepID=A0AAW0CKX3_9AGAR
MPTFLIPSSPPPPSPVPNRRRRPRPKGLWKARVTAEPRCLNSFSLSHRQRPLLSRHYSDYDSDHDSSVGSSSASSSTKKRRLLSSSASTVSSDDDEDDASSVCIWECTGSPPLSPLPTTPFSAFGDQENQLHCQPPAKRESRWKKRTKIMDTSSVATKGSEGSSTVFDMEDWEDLKDLFTNAAEQYESGLSAFLYHKSLLTFPAYADSEAAEALPILRGVIHECHRCLKIHHDPSLLFANPGTSPNPSPDTLTPPEERLRRDWLAPPLVSERPRKCTCVELPTAFHAIFGTALFLFGNLVAQDPSLALPGEPNTASPYWLAALDVFETGENLPSRTHGLGCDAPEDWRMAIVWGRTLVCLADEAITRQSTSDSTDDTPTPLWKESGPAPGTAGPDTPFTIIAQRRPPITGRMSLSTATPNDLMKLAMDQFSRGIFHMPHGSSASGSETSFSRAKELYTIASEVLVVAEKLSLAEERRYWAAWADSVFDQMQMGLQLELSQGAWKGRINRARGECLLIVGSALAEEIEDDLEKGGEAAASALESEEAVEAREVLGEAIVFLERAKSGVEAEVETERESRKAQKRGKRKRDCSEPEVEIVVHEPKEEDDDLQNLLAESLLTLANLTVDEKKREELYARAEKESRSGLELMDVCDS